jgi:hypothetical protein
LEVIHLHGFTVCDRQTLGLFDKFVEAFQLGLETDLGEGLLGQVSHLREYRATFDSARGTDAALFDNTEPLSDLNITLGHYFEVATFKVRAHFDTLGSTYEAFIIPRFPHIDRAFISYQANPLRYQFCVFHVDSCYVPGHMDVQVEVLGDPGLDIGDSWTGHCHMFYL